MAAIELCKEEGCVGLGVRGIDPLEGDANGALSGAPSAENAASIAAQAHGELLIRLVTCLGSP